MRIPKCIDACEYCGRDIGSGGCADDMPEACDDCWEARHFEPYSDLNYDHPYQREKNLRTMIEVKSQLISRLINNQILSG